MKWNDLAWRIATGLVEQREFEGLDYAMVRDAKMGRPVDGGDGYEMIVRARAGVIHRIDETPGAAKIEYIASTEHVDRMGDIIRVYGKNGAKGWRTENHKANPVGLWCHESWMPPIAKVETWRERSVKTHDGETGPALMSLFDYMVDENPVAAVTFKLAKKGALRAVSVGFKPIAYVDHQDRESRLNAGLGPYGVEFIEQDLHEISNCSVPANPFALQVELKSMVERGEVDDRDARVFAKMYPLTEKDLLAKLKERIRSVVDMGRSKVADAPEPKAADVDPDEAARVERTTGATPVAPATTTKAAATEPADKCVELTIRVRGVDVVRDAVKFLLAKERSESFRGALEGAAHRGIVEFDFVSPPDPDGSEQRIPDADQVAAAVSSETRQAVSTALGKAFEQLAAAQEAISAVMDVMECDVPADDVGAISDEDETRSDAPFTADQATEILSRLRTLTNSINRSGGDGGADAPNADSPDAAAELSFDLSEAERCVAGLKIHMAGKTAAK